MDAERKQENFRRGVELFNQRRFFECHEVLEAVWLEETPEEKPFFQGLIQVAAGFHQFFEKKNRRGAASLLRRGMKKLERYTPVHAGLDVAGLVAALDPWLDHLAGDEATAPPLPTIPPARR